MADRDAWEQPLYRYATVLLRDPDLARSATLDTLEAAIQKPPVNADAGRMAMLLFKDLRRRALRTGTAGVAPAQPAARGDLPAAAAAIVAPASAEDVASALHALPEPDRTALALLLLEALDADDIAKVLGLTEAEFSHALHRARLALHAALSARSPEIAA